MSPFHPGYRKIGQVPLGEAPVGIREFDYAPLGGCFRPPGLYEIAGPIEINPLALHPKATDRVPHPRYTEQHQMELG